MIVRKRRSIAMLMVLWALFYFSRHQWGTSSLSDGTNNQYLPGHPKVSGNYTRTVVIARRKSDDISWLYRLPESMSLAVYTLDEDDPNYVYRIPVNKGHEAMAYLTYIIDHYSSPDLSDTTIFLHSHLMAWHNNDLLDFDMLTTLAHLSDAHVARAGYFNTRCHYEPGCPDWLHPGRAVPQTPASAYDATKHELELAFTAAVWAELHPSRPLPRAIAQPCCAQFAVSRARIHSVPLREYQRYRAWLMETPLSDALSGRVMEYTWQTIFTGQTELCRPMNECYCDGYGVCFGGAWRMEEWFLVHEHMHAARREAKALMLQGGEIGVLDKQISEMEARLEREKRAAFERGKDPRLRAKECGRPWRVGDGF